ncbi:MAG: DsrE/DsrF/DrsH-like family protein [Actinomycetaceae bacterium]|nr:DsrE/DsrF/DrsH-like family protein [Actinomycetaceae bacterium]
MVEKKEKPEETKVEEEAVPMPDFGDGATGGEEGSGRKMCFICSKGTLDMAYPGLIMANAALGEGIEVHIFFTFWGLDIVNKKTMDNLKFTISGNTAMHMPELERLRPGWGTKSMPQTMAHIPGMTAIATKMMRKQMEDLDIPTVREMVEQVYEMGGHMWACKLTYDMLQMKPSHLHKAVEDVISATDFIEISEGAQIIFI